MRRQAEGFTIVEVIVTIVVSALFIGAIFSLYVYLTSLNKTTSEYNTADQLAYNNLRTFAYGAAPTWFECKADPDRVLDIPTSTVPGIAGNVRQEVVATAVFGCGGGSNYIGYPILVTSTVEYGGRKVSHATYASY